MDRKTNYPDSDESSRRKHPDAADEAMPDVDTSTPGLQTSNKSGKHSSAEKLAASRPEFGTGRGAQPVDGAFGRNEEGESHPTGRGASPGTNQFHCETCGRYFNTETELAAHETECRIAKAATPAGQRSMK